MGLRNLTGGDDDLCKDKLTCPGVWGDDEGEALAVEDAIVIGELLDPSPVPLGPGERAVRLRRSVLRQADLG